LLKVDTVNYDRPENARNKILFENLTPLHPTKRLRLERGNGSTEDITARILDLASPIGKGQRGLIVAPPKAGPATATAAAETPNFSSNAFTRSFSSRTVKAPTASRMSSLVRAICKSPENLVRMYEKRNA
jgi:hypothetical protein